MHLDVLVEPRVHPRLFIKLAQQRHEVEHVEDARGEVVGARRRFEGGRLRERVGERDVARGLLG